MPVLLTFDDELAQEISTILEHLEEFLMNFYQKYPKHSDLVVASDDDPIHEEYKQELLKALPAWLEPLSDLKLREIIYSDISEFINSHTPITPMTSQPSIFLHIYEAYTSSQLYGSGVYDLEYPKDTPINSFKSLDSYPSKKTLFIKYQLAYIKPQKLQEYLKAYQPIYRVMEELRILTRTKGSIEALPILSTKYHFTT